MTYEWNDDERAKGYTSYRAPLVQHTPSLGFICKDIVKDQSSHTKQLWNEVEYCNYAYEFAAPVYTVEVKEEPINEGSPNQELNSECFDHLVKNQTAYL